MPVMPRTQPRYSLAKTVFTQPPITKTSSTVLHNEAIALWENRNKNPVSAMPSATPTTPSSKIVIAPTTIKRKRKITPTYYHTLPKNPTADSEFPQSLWDRILQTFWVTLIYAVIGFLVDGGLYVAKAMVSKAPVSMFWLFLPILAVIGLILGWIMGGRALDALLIPFQTRDNPTFDEASFGYGVMKAIGLGLILAVIGWLILMIFT